MPWLEATPMEQRERFIRDEQSGLYTMTELCERHTISRKTGYKWLERFDAGGRAALGDRSRAPHRCPHRISDDVAALICTARRQHPSWGPRSSSRGWHRGTPASSCRPSARPAICWHDTVS
jgi:putative transposase